MAERPVTFAELLRQLRTGAGLTQEELAEAASVGVRSIRYLERGRVASPQKETVRLLAGALRLDGSARARFEAAARSGPSPGGVAAPVRTLPRDIASFTGRERELAELMGAVTGAADGGGAVGIHAIGGMAGVGKTAFAVHAAHRLADRFPGGQVFLPLCGHVPGQQPVDPADALASLLLITGVAPAQIPPGLEARSALWRDRLAGQQLLLILDDAAGSDQVLPLLPGTGHSLVLVTSRRHLSALDDAAAVSLDTLPDGDAAGLLIRLAGRPGLDAGDPGVAEITGLCGYLPLAIGMAARQLRHHPAWTAAGLAADLAAEAARLELMATENLSVAAAFDLSYADLSPDLQRLFRRLCLHPGTEIDDHAAAALDGVALAAARRGLGALYDQYLLAEVTPGRYRMHDLIREHARGLAGRHDRQEDRDQATGRLLDYFQHAAARAAARIARQTRPAPPAAQDPAPAAMPALAGSEQALAWARAERASLHACLDQAASTSQHARVIALTAGLGGLWRHDGPWAEAITRHEDAIQAAQHLGDRLGQANALNDLADLRRLTGDYPATVQTLEQALGIHRDLGDRLGQANDLSDLGAVRLATGDYPAAVRALEQALGIHRDLGDRLGQANTLNYLGAVRWLTSDYPAAARALEQALAIYRDLGDRSGQAMALNESGTLHWVGGDLARAERHHRQALALARAIAGPWYEAHALAGLGRCALAARHATQAAALLHQALEIFTRIGAAEAPELRAELAALTGPPPDDAPA